MSSSAAAHNAAAAAMTFGKERSVEGELLIQVVSAVLEELVSSSAAAAASSGMKHTPVVTKFHGLRAPSIAIRDYLQRISKFSGCSDECFVLALIYIDRLIMKRRITLDTLNVHRLLVTSVMLAAKFFDDQYLDNQHYAAVGGVPKGEINTLELEFLFLLEFNLHVTPYDYDLYRTALYAKVDPNQQHLLQQHHQQQQLTQMEPPPNSKAQQVYQEQYPQIDARQS